MRKWACGFRLADIPADVKTLATAELMSGIAACRAGYAHPAGGRVRARWQAPGPRGAALRAAAMTMLLDWDESTFAGHLGHATAVPALILAASAGADGERLLTTVVAAGEVAARVTAAVTLGRARGQAAAHTHLAGGTMAAGLLAGLSSGQLAAAVALALAQPREVLLPAFMGSDAKFAVAAGPLADAFTAVDAAAAEAASDREILERQGGVFDRLAEVPLPEAMSGWGDRWHLRTLSFKRDPGCAYLSAASEAACGLGPMDLDTVEAVEVGASMFTLGMEAESARFLAGPATPLPALNFSLGYTIAVALQTGGVEPADFTPVATAGPDRWQVAGRVTALHDSGLTLAALAATAPVGAALAWAGERARPYLERRGAPPETVSRILEAAAENLDDPNFLRPAKRIGALVRVRLRDGRIVESGRGAAARSAGVARGKDGSRAREARPCGGGGGGKYGPDVLGPELAWLSAPQLREAAAPLLTMLAPAQE